jgi:ubiquitin
MLVNVRVLTRIIPLEVDLTDTIVTVKQKLEDLEGVPAEQQRFIFAGRCLDDSQTLSDYSIQSESTIHLVLRLSPLLSLEILLVNCHAPAIVDGEEEGEEGEVDRISYNGTIVEEEGYQILKIERRADTTVSELKACIRTRLGLDLSAFERGDLTDTLTPTSTSAADHNDGETRLRDMKLQHGDQLVYQLARFSE